MSSDEEDVPGTLSPISSIEDGFDVAEEDRVFIGRLEQKVREHDAVRKSIEVNDERDARLTFDDGAEDELQEMVDRNFRLYTKISDDEAVARLLFDFFFDRMLEEVRQEAAEG